ncbi:MAG: sugar transferase [Caldilineaceae bacterium]|nr:sugar transferase [Caldilineaceae bacterium]MBP8121608.1 sugar transferase [Caldilineaceae bacterium]MBP9072521.1 sugar transferase [Caldilineaceae bacterium]
MPSSLNASKPADSPTQNDPVERDKVDRANWFVAFMSTVPRSSLPNIVLVIDALLILVAFLLAYQIRYRLQWFRAVDPVFQASLTTYVPFATALLPVMLFSFYLTGVYRSRRGRGYLDQMWAIATATTMGVVMLMAASLLQPLAYSRLIFIYTAVLVILLLGISRAILFGLRNYLRRFGVGVDRVVLIGAGDVGRMVMRNIVARPDLGFKLIGFLDDNPTKNSTDIGRFKALGSLANFRDVVEEHKLDRAIICLPWQSHRTVVRLLNDCERVGIQAQVVPDLFQLTKNQIEMEELNGIPLISSRQVSITGWNRLVKRTVDLVISAIALLLTLPFTLLIGLAIRLDSSGPVLYTQARIGKEGKPFRVYKFRSMIAGAESLREQMARLNESTGPLFKIRDDPRATRVGTFLRRYSLDELPQLLNVLRGEMSLIGPRPNLPEEVAAYSEWHKKRLSVSPGMTGLWQVSGRSDLTFDEMVLLDIYYAENWCMSMDLTILMRTLPAVLLKRGAY